MPRYEPQRIERKWQAFWEARGTFAAPELPRGEKLYVLDMFPYPSGDGLHVGHPEGYTATDIVCRYARMRGKSVLHPMGWDAFGLPAEQRAIETGTHPRITTQKNIETFRRQLKSLGFSYDWNREISTTDPEYFRWTQWIFLQLFDTWYDPEFEWTGPDGRPRRGRGRPIADLPLPVEIVAAGQAAVRRYQDSQRLAYLHGAPVNWCPALGTVLANEEVTADGRSDRGNHPVERRFLRQWMLRITAYAERLLEELDEVNWPESIKLLQRNWIGRSEGAEVDFFIGAGLSVPGIAAHAHNPATGQFTAWKEQREKTGFPREAGADVLRVYTTRPDTLFGATYMVIAPEHPSRGRLTTASQQAAVEAYCQKAATKSDLDRTELAKEKTGVFTGSYAINPVTGAPIPIWIADYVLISYGTGAIMAVPAHDERDLEFARRFGLPVLEVVSPPEGSSIPATGFTGEGLAMNSGEYTGLPTRQFKSQMTADLAQRGWGRQAINYRLRDWLFSRQRYWGEPFPIWHELDAAGDPTGLVRAAAESELPIALPEMEDFKPTGTPDPLLSKAPAHWLYATAADGTRLKRETNTMPQWAGSCWYFLRFIDPRNATAFLDSEKEKAWMPVDLYIGGAEHAVLHLLYSRFWHKVLFDRGHVSMAEPFRRLVNQGMILGEAEITGYQDAAGGWVSAREVTAGPEGGAEVIDRRTGHPVTAVKLSADQVEKKGEGFQLKERSEVAVDSRAYKMSKSRGNVVNPDKVVAEYGADSLRLYEMFMGPLEATKPWSMSGVEGVHRFLARVWRTFTDERSDVIGLHAGVRDVPVSEEQQRLLHKTIAAVTRDIEALSFNTAISRLMEFINAVSALETRPRALLAPFVLLLSPLAPHLAEELWELLGHSQSLAYESWPMAEERWLVESVVEIPVQVNGKLRAKISVPKGSAQGDCETAAWREPRVVEHLSGKQVVKVIYVADRLLNFVVK